MSLISSNFYAQWREQNRTFILREGDAIPPERLLQAIWHHQRILRNQLLTLDGKTLRVLHPGFWNRESGPDFRGAVLQIGHEIVNGDVEIDLRHSGWRDHGHDRNPNFKNVVLHIVWDAEGKNINLPCLALKDFLDAPLPQLAAWLGSEAAQAWPSGLSGNCCAPLREFSEEKLCGLLREAARVRLEYKAREFEIRARQVGWEQSLWEGLFRALGYKQNIWPMRRLGELLPNLMAGKTSVFELQARLLGVSGLLPDELPKMKSAVDDYVRRIWDCWWRERECFAECILPRSVWKFNGLRPANHPQRRLALAAHWMAKKDFLPKLEQWFTAPLPKNENASRLLEVFQVESDEFWSRHWTFRSAPLTKPQPLLGTKRVTDLAINVILPWFWMRAVAGKNVNLSRMAEERYFAWPTAEDNSVLRLARQRLLGENKSRLFRSAAAQQGLLQIVKDFCEHSNAICSNCQFPDLVKKWGQ